MKLFNDKGKNVLKKQEAPAANPQSVEKTATSSESAFQIMYYLVAADGRICPEELEQLDSIAKELNLDVASNVSRLIQECQRQLDKVIDPEDLKMVIEDGVDQTIAHFKKAEDGAVSPKLLVWDLLSIAYSDGAYDATERQLIKYVVLKLEVESAIFLEMESTIATLMDLDREVTWLKQTDRPYIQIETMVNEIADRKNVIMESVNDLIAF